MVTVIHKIAMSGASIPIYIIIFYIPDCMNLTKPVEDAISRLEQKASESPSSTQHAHIPSPATPRHTSVERQTRADVQTKAQRSISQSPSSDCKFCVNNHPSIYCDKIISVLLARFKYLILI